MKNERLVHILADWGRSLQSGIRNKEEVITRAVSHNPWFTPKHINYALDQICDNYLNAKALQKWLSKYEGIPVEHSRRVGLVMAGNIPLAGFHDLLSVLVTGHDPVVKLSEKDPYLLPYCIDVLKEKDREMAGRIKIVETLNDFDAVIATGSNNASKYFKAYFGKYPHIIRRNRNGVAVVTGDETPDQLERLADDIFLYFGLGCRSVSKLYLPEDFDLNALKPALDKYDDFRDHHKYRNNLDYNAALLILSGKRHWASDHIILAEDTRIASRIATLHFEYYDSPARLARHLQDQKEQLQCIVSEKPLDAITVVPFGAAQQPSLTDYADNVDTVEFLLNLEPIEAKRESKSHS